MLPSLRHLRPSGFSTIELLLVVSLSAIVIGGAVTTYGTIVQNQGTLSGPVSVPLGTANMVNFYGDGSSSTFEAVPAPSAGASTLAEQMREEFNNDVHEATAVFCLGRNGLNTYRPSLIAYNPLTHSELDTPQKFRQHLITIGAVSSTLYVDYRNPGSGSIQPQNASIFILGYSRFSGYLKVNAIYEIDLVRFAGGTLGDPQGIFASVRRYAAPASGADDAALAYNHSYEVFYPPSVPNYSYLRPNEWVDDGFAPLFVSFERSSRMALREGSAIDRFKRAAESPFYFVWWPDPLARHLGPVSDALDATDPRAAYNRMGGRTSYMFTVRMFPAL